MTIHTARKPEYTGRFAPSPSGPLHFGSLVCALASFLDARSHGGDWLVRIDDIDPPREMAGAKDAILSALDAHGLQWDSEILYQSSRSDAYRQTLTNWRERDWLYPCCCTRKRIAALPQHRYDGYCRAHPPATDKPSALRLDIERVLRDTGASPIVTMTDDIQPPLTVAVETFGDFVVHRKDGLFAYQLAVAVDDRFQRITDVVRGSDLLTATPQQHFLISLLGGTPPRYAHHPVIINRAGAKLSKQNHAPPVAAKYASENLFFALQCLGQNPDSALCRSSPAEILAWAVAHWTLTAIPRKTEVTAPSEHFM